MGEPNQGKGVARKALSIVRKKKPTYGKKPTTVVPRQNNPLGSPERKGRKSGRSRRNEKN